MLEKHYMPQRNETMDIHMFFMRKQESGEFFENFYADLKKLI